MISGNLKYAYYDRDIADILWKRKKDLSDGEIIGLKDYFSIVRMEKSAAM